MGHGLSQYFAATMASGASITSDVNLGRAFTKVYVNIAGATNSCHFLAAPSVSGSPGTYSPVKYNVASGMSAPQTITVGTATSGSFVEVPLGGIAFIKVASVGGSADGAIIKVIASDV